jgi:two-component system, OmpR family, response regulator
MAERLLIVDDDQRLTAMVSDYLVAAGFSVDTRPNGAEGLAALTRNPFDAVILDIMLPDTDGFEICRQIRTRSEIPVLMLTAKGEETDRIIGLEIGADDYLPKPFNPRELLARIRAVLRRTIDRADRKVEPAARAIRFSGWTLEPARRRLLNPEGAEVTLTGGEYDLLVALLDRANRVLTRDMLLDLLRGRQAGPFDRAIDVAISRLRRKLEDDGRRAQIIKTVRGGGYVLASDVERV